MTSLVFCLSLVPAFLLLYSKGRAKVSNIGFLLLLLYFFVGLCGGLGLAFGLIVPVFFDNYWAVLVLSICIGIISVAFASFDSARLPDLFSRLRNRRVVEDILIGLQIYSIMFFLPFAIGAFRGDVNFNRENITETMAVLESLGWMNTLAGIGAQLFVVTLVLSFVRVAPSAYGVRNVPRASILLLASLSYPIYIFAYAGRDGVVLWVMTAFVLYLIFYPYMSVSDRAICRRILFFVLILLFLPFSAITISRFFSEGQMGVGGVFQYFGAQIQNFSDYSSFERPITYGIASFPIFGSAVCALFDLSCANWNDIKSDVFKEYLDSGIEPWLFGTFVNDFAGDFGLWGALGVCVIFTLFVFFVCKRGNREAGLSLSRFLAVMLCYLVPFWGVFYFRFSISNGALVANGLFIAAVWILERIRISRGRVRCAE